jgi:hypothetical protein
MSSRERPRGWAGGLTAVPHICSARGKPRDFPGFSFVPDSLTYATLGDSPITTFWKIQATAGRDVIAGTPFRPAYLSNSARKRKSCTALATSLSNGCGTSGATVVRMRANAVSRLCQRVLMA